MVITLSENNNKYFQKYRHTMYQGVILWGELYLYSSWHQAVCSSEDELFSVVAVWWGQDNLACPWAVSRCQNELLLGSTGRLHRCHYLDLLTCLLISYNLTEGDRKRGRWKLTCTNEVEKRKREKKEKRERLKVGEISHMLLHQLVHCCCFCKCAETGSNR